jgi:hypothetical protein
MHTQPEGLAMTERSLFNVLCKSLGLWMTFQGVTALIWAFLASRYSEQIPFDPPEFASWFSGAASAAFGVILSTRSSKITRFLFGLDGPLDAVGQHSADS